MIVKCDYFMIVFVEFNLFVLFDFWLCLLFCFDFLIGFWVFVLVVGWFDWVEWFECFGFGLLIGGFVDIMKFELVCLKLVLFVNEY